MVKNERKKAAWIILIGWLAYLISYLGRSDYSACMLEILNETGVSRTMAGMVSSSFAICNAFGQIAAAMVMRKFSPMKVIAVEIFTVFGVNVLFPATDSFVVMAVLWGVNGAMQATLLCGLTQIFACSLKEPYLSRGAVLLNTIGAVGGLFNYVLTYFLIRWFHWQTVFFTVSCLLAVIGVVWCTAMPKLAGPVEKAQTKTRQPFSLKKCLVSCGAAYVIVAAFFVGGLRESVSLWIPTYLKDTFRLPAEVATVITAVVPCVQVSGAFLGGSIGRRCKVLQFPALGAFGLSAFCLLLIRLLGDFNPAVSVGLFAINAVSMTAALTFLVSLFPIRYVHASGVATMVAIINFSVHAGDFAAATGLGSLSQYGWNVAFTVLCGGALLGAAVCLLGGIACAKEKANAKN